MNLPRFAPHLLAAVLGTAALTFPAIARAECATDADCGTGFICQAFESQVCTAYACVEGQPCPAPTCEPVQYHECVPAPCTVDSDCGDGMVCLEQTSVSCPPAPAYDCIDPNSCPTIEPVDCTPTTTRTCAPRYMAPCTVDADCGAGFTCVPQESCTCSGGGATEPAPYPADGGTSTYNEPVPPDCACTTTGTNSCQMQQIPCTTDSECPTDWTCVAYASGGVGCAVPVYPDGGTGDTTCDPAPEPTTYSQCQPPYYGSYVFGNVGYTSGTAENSSAKAGIDAGTVATAPTAGDPLPGDSTDTTTNGLGSDSGSHDSGGCRVGLGGANATGGVLLAALGLLGVVRRRREAR